MSQRRVKRANADVIDSHWCNLVENMSASPADFYRRLREVIRDRKIPNLDEGHVQWREGGLLSAKRLYFRLLRERIVIDVCAAPFGTGFFVSWRLGHIWLRLNFLGALMLIAGVIAALGTAYDNYRFEILYLTYRYHSWIPWGIIGTAVFLLVMLNVMRGAVAAGLSDLDALFLHTPILAGFYERFLRPVTYYRVDLALMYEQAVHAAVMQVVDEFTDVQKLPRLSEDQRKPIRRDCYKR
jgi:hypothetical protein